MKKDIKKIINLPEEYHVEILNKEITISKGSEKIKLKHKIRGLIIRKEENSIIIEKKFANKKDKREINSLVSHINNAIRGLKEKYEYLLQICSIHFPMSVKIERDKLIVKNFFGERKERVLNILPGVEIKIENDIIRVISSNKELAGKQASLIENLTKITNRDKRVFQDGIWIIKKAKGKSI